MGGDQIRGGRPNPLADLDRGDQIRGDTGLVLILHMRTRAFHGRV